MKKEVVTLGETMVSFNPTQPLPLEHVFQFEKHIAGAESNVCIALSRLGHSTGWISKLGNDPFGYYIRNCIRGEGVDTSQCTFTDENPTGLLFKEKKTNQINVYYYRENSAASYLSPDNINENYIKNAKVLHITGITATLSDNCKDAVFKAIKIAKRYNVIIVLDPNIRSKIWIENKSREILRDLTEQADILLPGLDEGKIITGKHTPEEIGEELNKYDEKTVIIKLGSEGAYYHTDKNKGYIEAAKIKQVIDPIGAGDGFAAGIISGVLKKQSIEETIMKAHAIGAIVVESSGDVEGLPKKEELNQFLHPKKNISDVNR